MSKFRLSCTEANERHIRFSVFDFRGANVGTLTVLTCDVKKFLQDNWSGDVNWNGYWPAPKMEMEVVK